MNTQETLGQRLQRLRAAANLTQAQVATAAGVPLSSLQNWEIDRREPSFRAACRLAKALGVTAEHLADTASVEEAGKAARPAGPTKRPQTPDQSTPPPVGQAQRGQPATQAGPQMPPPQRKPARRKPSRPRGG
jgi:transcriptional regulator with XRE-family HTH domain